MAWPHLRKRIIRRAVFGMFGLLTVGLLASWFVAGRLVAPKRHVIGPPPGDLPANSIALESKSGVQVAGWHLRSETPKGVVVLLHGMHASRLTMLPRARLLWAAGYSVVMIDLQGHGESPGEQITIGYLEKHDVRAAVAFARQEHPDEPLGIVGVSLGGVSTLLASPLEIDAMVLESVYPDIDSAIHNRVAAKLGVLSTIPATLLLIQLEPRTGISPGHLRPIDYVSQVDCPIFLISGAEDLHTTQSETEQMFALARDPKDLWIVEGAAHVDLYSAASRQYKSRVLAFLDKHLRTQNSEASLTKEP